MLPSRSARCFFLQRRSSMLYAGVRARLSQRPFRCVGAAATYAVAAAPTASTRSGLVHSTRPLLFFSSWLGQSSNYRGSAVASAKVTAKDTFISENAVGLGRQDVGQPMANESVEATEGNAVGGQSPRGGLPRQQMGGGASPGSTVPKQAIDDILIERGAHLTGPSRRPVSYDLEIHRAARAREAQQQQATVEYAKEFDEANMPRHPDDPNRTRASWEFTPTAEHKALVLLLYRNVLKGLMHYKSVRKRSMIAYARMCFRRRAQATEKLLIDECIEECRRAIYVLEKHHNFTKTGTYEFDSMSIPKDTGQDVKTYMEEVYDPEVSRQQFQSFADVEPGKEHLHRQGLGPTSGAHHWKDQRSSEAFKVEIRDEDKALRPPPPPGMAS
ncbi:putative mitochondrial hypothetical protein [Leptomonas pyrrhocoris]|uniref:Uncharacterized protein n=1 Tax=Leptomonas pyrrhocoris TaxID=157538 RepID=A0A0N0DRN3_LEPPY|nr:putative mitochondrial hypothetical protein [Leptomonas pyrrhocoris]XP_015653151.1 putative mitochondrial hypothetical protein [Leptomonas pyrrhocoris]KPA74711.1 putative mitochondrial hypothetical protein [Leptomonas pyrrhocoris]KPA74712.1 putative mitochondrial hypothetical protein [Leptomonas pyrrhocoris]|eukprot:XP_015653150.1 putative mitochondrial hypothetical protein [Leptomonas pyrrhocoris]